MLELARLSPREGMLGDRDRGGLVSIAIPAARAGESLP